MWSCVVEKTGTEASFLICIYLFLTMLFHPSFMISTFIINLISLGGDIPCHTSYGVYMNNYCRFRNVRKNVIFAKICEICLRIQSSR